MSQKDGSTTDIEQTSVLIVGGGVVGLSASLFLADQGVKPVLIERHPSTCIHPRARGINPRTMEIMRSYGLEEAIREGGKSLKDARGIYEGTTMVEVMGRNTRIYYIGLVLAFLVLLFGSFYYFY